MTADARRTADGRWLPHPRAVILAAFFALAAPAGAPADESGIEAESAVAAVGGVVLRQLILLGFGLPEDPRRVSDD